MKDLSMIRKGSSDSLRLSALEQGFKLPLATTVEGQDAQGRRFKEDTKLSYISHQGASFLLKSAMTIGTKVKLIIDLPPKLSEDKDLKLAIHGKVVFVEAGDHGEGRQKISVRLESKYIIKPEE
jgi:hypothetical protein